MEDSSCISCRKPKTTHTCEVCEESLCKKCAQILDQSTFAFLEQVPAELQHSVYCGSCYDGTVAPALDSYEEILERAKKVYVFFKTQKKDIPLIKRSRDTLTIPECIDRDETILRLAFLAAQADFNGLVEVEVLSEKVRNGAYQTSKWRGVGTPAMIDGDRIARLDLLDLMYR